MAVLICCVNVDAAAARSKSKPSKNATVPALILQQTHIYLGKTKVTLTPDAVRMDGQGKFHFSLISKAPTWNITVFRTDDRLSCTQPLSEFYDQGLFSNMVLNAKSRFLPTGGTVTNKKINGFAVRQTSWADVIFVSFPRKGYAPQEAESILYAAYKVPTENQIPIRYAVLLTGKDWMTNLSQAGLRREFLTTEKISKQLVSTAEFEVPSGLAQTKSVTRIIVGSENKLRDTGADVLFKLGK